jgi:hypothetical protein
METLPHPGAARTAEKFLQSIFITSSVPEPQQKIQLLAEKIIKIMKKRFLSLQDEFYALIDRIF